MRRAVGTGRVVLIVLGLVLLAGVALRVVAAMAWWPIGTSLANSWPYAYYASGVNPLLNPQHPPGYSVVLALVGTVTREVAIFAILQHLLAVGAALVLFFAVRRLCGSSWPGVAAAATVLLGADQIYLERTIMSEAVFLAVLAVAILATARMLDSADAWWPWPVIAACLLVIAGLTRSAGLFLLPVVALALVLARPRPWLPRWRPVVAFLGTATVLVLAYAGANAASHGRFEAAPTGGWHLYARVAPFADCGQFDPPPDTDGLCERSDPRDRPGGDWYLYDRASPAKRAFGPTPFERDDDLGAFARQAVLHQPKTYLQAVWRDVRAYYVPGSFEYAPGRGSDLDGQLDWAGAINRDVERQTEREMERAFFDDFAVDRDRALLAFLHDYQRVFRFGGAALLLATLLIAVGLLVGSRRERIAVLVLGVGGLAMFVLPTLSVIYIARYTVPPAPLIVAGAAVAALAIGRRLGSRRQGLAVR